MPRHPALVDLQLCAAEAMADECQCPNRRARDAFTLNELLIVVAVIGALAALTVPGWNLQKEKSRRVRCRGNLRVLAGSAHMYASDNRAQIYDNTAENGYWNTQCVTPGAFKSMVYEVIGDDFVDCPGLRPFSVPGAVVAPGDRVGRDGGVYIGYNYLGGIKRLPAEAGWKSPLTTFDAPDTPLFTDANNYGFEDRPWVVIPHRPTGPARLGGSTFLWLDWVLTPKSYGGEGGNVVTLDGSVEWKPIDRLNGDHWIARRDVMSRGYW
ncbi:MAG TPA: type II secretion system protein [Candidatus Limnocylindria bacterium]|nr:type II secretion system protein [Candidatus Limnocylindria bacterium]